jgi:hypothetical protein
MVFVWLDQAFEGCEAYVFAVEYLSDLHILQNDRNQHHQQSKCSKIKPSVLLGILDIPNPFHYTVRRRGGISQSST